MNKLDFILSENARRQQQYYFTGDEKIGDLWGVPVFLSENTPQDSITMFSSNLGVFYIYNVLLGNKNIFWQDLSAHKPEKLLVRDKDVMLSFTEY